MRRAAVATACIFERKRASPCICSTGQARRSSWRAGTGRRNASPRMRVFCSKRRWPRAPAAAQPVLEWLERTGLEHVGIEALVDRLAETS